MAQFSAPQLYGALRHATAIIEKRNTIPVIGHARLHWAPGQERARLEATDLDMFLTCELDSCDCPIDVMLPPALTMRMLHAENGTVTITSDDEHVTLEVGDSSARWRKVFLPEDFPAWQATNDMAEPFETTQKDLWDMLHTSSFCISTEETRYYLNGIHIDNEEEVTKAVATDGHRMSIFDLPEAWKGGGCIIPRKAVKTIQGTLHRSGNIPARLQLGEQRGRVTIGDYDLQFKMIDGKFPDWRRVIPKAECSFSTTIDDMSLSKFPPRGALELRPEEGFMTLRDHHFGNGERIKVPLTGKGKPRGFNVGLLRSLCRAAGGPIQLQGADPEHAAHVLPEDPRARFVLMPMRI